METPVAVKTPNPMSLATSSHAYWVLCSGETRQKNQSSVYITHWKKASPTFWPFGTYEKVANDLGLGGGFHWVPWFPPPVTTGYSRFCRNMAEKVTKNEIQNFKFPTLQSRRGLKPYLVVHIRRHTEIP